MPVAPWSAMGGMASQLARFVVVSVWIGLMVALWQQGGEVPTEQNAQVLPQSSGADSGAWMGLYMNDKKVGYSSSAITRARDGYSLTDRSVLRLRMMEQDQTITAHSAAETDESYALRSFRVRLQSGIGDFEIAGKVEDAALVVTTKLGAQSDVRSFPLAEPVYLPSALRARLVAEGLEKGATRKAAVFDAAAMAASPITIEVIARERIDSLDGSVDAWRLRESFRGVESTVWLDDSGAVLREEGPLGLVAVRESAQRATGHGWGEGALVDLMDAVAIPIANPIASPRALAHLRVKIRGIESLPVADDHRQRFEGDALTIERESLAATDTFSLPYRSADQAAALAPSSFVQSDHPRLVSTAREIVGDETDARAAAVKLRRWVYEEIDKRPVASIPNALQVLEMGAGDCNEHAVLFAALARAVGLPARIAAGVVYADGVFLYHAWNEVWLGRQWVSVDAAFDQMPADATHLKLVDGEPDRHVELVPMIGKLSIDVLDAG